MLQKWLECGSKGPFSQLKYLLIAPTFGGGGGGGQAPPDLYTLVPTPMVCIDLYVCVAIDFVLCTHEYFCSLACICVGESDTGGGGGGDMHASTEAPYMVRLSS